MSITSKFCFLVCLCLLCSCTALPGCLDTGNAGHQEVADSDEVGLLQHPVVLTTSQKRMAKLGSTPPHENGNLLDLKMSKHQILAELQLAKDARQSWENRIAALEILLSTSIHSKDDSQGKALSESPLKWHWHLQTIVLLVIWCIVFCFCVHSVLKYERERGEFDFHWYHHSQTMSKIMASFLLLWIIGGISVFTGFMFFNDEKRHLTLIESLYLNVQILTTIGYGDLTPNTNYGLLFMAVYVFLGCSIVATLVGEAVSMYLDWQERYFNTFSKIRRKFWIRNKGPIVQMLCIAFGTIFYGTMPGENKTYLESFYMSTVTLLTIGFGKFTCLTPLGQLVGSMWMLVGWVAFAQAITDVSSMVFSHRRRFKSKASAVGYFKDITQERGNLFSKAEFFTFEMLRLGIDETQIKETNAKFHEIDTNKDNSLQTSEFQAYLDELYPDGH
mmetsp:Transcript_6452/g.10959  ORF Transcript_6452/g.10959 Transcript_6452/m.10959 type:complete len:445 (-) Transcript_6452:251-1585(-)